MKCPNKIVKICIEGGLGLHYEIFVVKIALTKDINASSFLPATTGFFVKILFHMLLTVALIFLKLYTTKRKSSVKTHIAADSVNGRSRLPLEHFL